MANTYLQMHVHLVFATKNRNALIKTELKDALEKYITGIVQNHKHKMLAIKSVSDHIHIFIGYNVNHLIPDLVEEIKISSNQWIKVNKLSPFKFEWQKGYGGFSHSHSQVEIVTNLIFLKIDSFNAAIQMFWCAAPTNASTIIKLQMLSGSAATKCDSN